MARLVATCCRSDATVVPSRPAATLPAGELVRYLAPIAATDTFTASGFSQPATRKEVRVQGSRHKRPRAHAHPAAHQPVGTGAGWLLHLGATVRPAGTTAATRADDRRTTGAAGCPRPAAFCRSPAATHCHADARAARRK